MPIYIIKGEKYGRRNTMIRRLINFFKSKRRDYLGLSMDKRLLIAYLDSYNKKKKG